MMGVDYWADDAEYSVANWQREVAEGETRAGYLAWVKGERDYKREELTHPNAHYRAEPSDRGTE